MTTLDNSPEVLVLKACINEAAGKLAELHEAAMAAAKSTGMSDPASWTCYYMTCFLTKMSGVYAESGSTRLEATLANCAISKAAAND